MVSRSCLTAFALVLSLSSAAIAQPTEQPTPVNDLLRRGVQLREQGDDQGALVAFQRAMALSPEARVLAQIALAEQALGRWVESAAHLREALRSPNDPWIQRNHGALEESLRVIAQHLGRLRIEGGIPGAEVLVDSVPVGTLPRSEPIELRAGSVALEVRAEGYFSVTRRVEVPAEGEARELITLVRTTDPTAPPPPPPPPVPTIVTRMNPTARAVGWITFSAAALVAGGAGAMLYLHEDAVSQYNTNPLCPGAASLRQPEQCNTLLVSGDNDRVMAYVGFGLAGALVATSAIVFLAAPRERMPHSESPRARVACAPTLGVTGAACALTF